jgi:hypothetical protein
VLDDVEVRRVGWPSQNSKLLLDKALLHYVGRMYSRVVLLKNGVCWFHAIIFEGRKNIVIEDGEVEF